MDETTTAGPAAAFRGDEVIFPLLVEALDLSLHYGLFEPGATPPPSLEALREAQAAFTREVLAWVPEDARAVLDVGTGRGELARALGASGREVLTIAPDPNQGRWLEQAPCPGVRFEATAFQALSTRRLFDAVVFSESANYVALPVLFERSRVLTRPGGALLLAAPFLRRPSPIFTDMHRLDALHEAARRHGWRLECEDEWSARVAPTLALGRALYRRAACELPARLAGALRRPGARLRARAGAALLSAAAWLGRRIGEGRTLARLDPEAFLEAVTFGVLLFRRGEGEA